MASRYVGRVEYHILRRKCSASISKLQARKSTRQYVTQPTLESQTQGISSSLSPSPSTQEDRDPSLPPKPPPETYPHPYPNSRDDPHSNSMRVFYQNPASMSQKSWQSSHVPSKQSAFSKGGSNVVSAERWAQINALSGIDFSAGAMSSLPALPPLYVIHIKSTSNNTIITLHAPPTPKSQVLSKSLSKSATTSQTAMPSSSFSVESNPDAVPQEGDVMASEPPKAEPLDTYTASSTDTSPPSTPLDLPASSSFTPPKANRCIGWASGGSCHYKKVNRSTYEAGYAASVRIIRRVEEAFEHLAAGGRIEDLAPMKEVKGAMSTLSDITRSQGNSRKAFRLRVVYTGFGTGREAFNAAVLSADGAFTRGLIGQVQDKTPIKVGGCRGKKTRRV